MKITHKVMAGLVASTLILTACGNTESAAPSPEADSAHDRLEAQGIVYSEDDYETTVRRLCASDHPEVYMGITGAIEDSRGSMSGADQTNAILGAVGGGEAPNADVLSDREKRMVIDLVLDSECGE